MKRAGTFMWRAVDVSQAGEGQLEIMVNRGMVKNSVRSLGKGLFTVSFIPRDSRPHFVDVMFNGEPIPRAFCLYFNNNSNIIIITRSLDCDQSNVYSSRAVFSAISQGLFVLPLYIVGRLVTLPHEISFESLSLHIKRPRAKYGLCTYIQWIG